MDRKHRTAAGTVVGALAALFAAAAGAAETQLCSAERQGEGWAAFTAAELVDGDVVGTNLIVTYRAPFLDLHDGDSVLVEEDRTGAVPTGELTVQYVGPTDTGSGRVAIAVPAFTDGVAAILGGLGGKQTAPPRHLLRWTADGETLLEAEAAPNPSSSGQAGSALNAAIVRWDDPETAGAPTPVRDAIDRFVLSDGSAVDVFVELSGGELVHAGVLEIPGPLMKEADAGIRAAISEQIAMIREDRCTAL